MKLVADENIVALTDYFADQCELVSLPGREITAGVVKDADALLVRSVTTVNATLLAGSSVQFVGSITSGVDHVDRDWLRRAGIAFHYAAGANANSVVEYVFSALSALQVQRNIDWSRCGIGIIGAGNIGGLLARKLDQLGIVHAVHDPYLTSDSEHDAKRRPWEEVLNQDVITVHTPLTYSTTQPTWHLLDTEAIDSLAPGSVLINTARGAVVDNDALLARLQRRHDLHVVLDAWENEPAINLELLGLATIATPHIAGYSLDGKRLGTEMIFRAFCHYFSLEFTVDKERQEESFIIDLGHLQPGGVPSAVLDHCNLAAYNILADHHKMQSVKRHEHPPLQFDLLRKYYPGRYEFGHFRVLNVPDERNAGRLRALGFRVES